MVEVYISTWLVSTSSKTENLSYYDFSYFFVHDMKKYTQRSETFSNYLHNYLPNTLKFVKNVGLFIDI